MICSDEDERLIKSMAVEVLVDLWKDIARTIPEYKFSWRIDEVDGGWVSILDDDRVDENDGMSPRQVIYISKYGGRPAEDPYQGEMDLILHLMAFENFSVGKLWYMWDQPWRQSLEAVDIIMPIVQTKVIELIKRSKKAKEAVRTTRALSETATFRERGPIETGMFTRARRMRLDATDSNDAATSALTVFQDRYLRPQLREVGARFEDMGMSTGPRAQLARARSSPFLRDIFRGGRSKDLERRSRIIDQLQPFLPTSFYNKLKAQL